MPASTPAHALLAGATGLVGALTLRRLLADPRWARVTTLVRRPTGVAHERLDERLVDFATLDNNEALPRATAAICALGTTMKKAGSRDAFRAVDLHAVVAFARAARAAGADTFALVSSAGADARSRTFYLKTKGEAEAAVAALGFPSLTVLRPGVLLGDRGESRPGEAIARAILPFVSPLLAGPFRPYRPIGADVVAAALVRAAAASLPGQHVLGNDAIAAMADPPKNDP
jgi:uncharacterized protein YbjT (DUF2867 family)